MCFLQVEIDVNLCFCSEHTCNGPDGELLTEHLLSSGADSRSRLVVTSSHLAAACLASLAVARMGL